MLRGKAHKSCTKQCIWTCRKDTYGMVLPINGKIDLTTGALTDPVALHRQNGIGPARHTLGTFKKLFSVVGYAEEPLIQLFLFNLILAAPATFFLNLLIGEHRFAFWAPVDSSTFLVGQPLLHHLQEDQLLPAIIVRLAGRQLPVPVIGQAHALELGAHVGNILPGPFRRMCSMLDSRVLSRHTEGIPTHRVQYVIALQTFETGNNITDRVIAHVSHMNTTGGVREHLQQVIFRFTVIDGHGPGLGLRPLLLPGDL